MNVSGVGDDVERVYALRLQMANAYEAITPHPMRAAMMQIAARLDHVSQAPVARMSRADRGKAAKDVGVECNI